MFCPNCNNYVGASDTIDTEWCDNKYYDNVEGVCPKCGKMWNWTEVYIFDHDEDVHEINENNHL